MKTEKLKLEKPWVTNKTLIQKGIHADFECERITLLYQKPPVIKVSFDPKKPTPDTIDIDFNPYSKEKWTKETISELENRTETTLGFEGVESVSELAGVYFVFFQDGDRMKVWKERLKWFYVHNETSKCECN